MSADAIEMAVARAICEADGHDPDTNWALPTARQIDARKEPAPEPAWLSYMPNARAAIRAVDAGRSSERIIMAAWKEGNAIYTIERPGRHHSIAHALRDNGRLTPEKPLLNDSGFLTSAGRFVDRREGCQIARAAGQIVEKHGPDYELFSEDMW